MIFIDFWTIKEFEEMLIETVSEKEKIEVAEERLKKLIKLFLCEKKDEEIYGSFRSFRKFNEKEFKKFLKRIPQSVEAEVRFVIFLKHGFLHFTPPWWDWLDGYGNELREDFVDFKNEKTKLSKDEVILFYEEKINSFGKDYGISIPWEEEKISGYLWDWVEYRRKKFAHLWRSYHSGPYQILAELLIKV
uniref:Uncharacterized protein n=1 Tax=Thermodesulfobacterium geofontis TaxID=1295609 RepID=A0A7V5XFK2_9BACT